MVSIGASPRERFWSTLDGDELAGFESVGQIGQHLVEYSNHPSRSYEFVVLSGLKTAASYGNGKIGVGFTLLTQMTNNYQLAAVLAHEVAHDNLGHFERANKILADQRRKFPVIVLRMAHVADLLKWGKVSRVVALYKISSLVYEITQFRKSFNASCCAMELDADKLAIEFLIRAGYPRETFMAAFDVIPREDRPYHPPYQERKEHAQQIVDNRCYFIVI